MEGSEEVAQNAPDWTEEEPRDKFEGGVKDDIKKVNMKYDQLDKQESNATNDLEDYCLTMRLSVAEERLQD
eukprot:1303745-Alexandrium_andersonii.AAC.1